MQRVTHPIGYGMTLLLAWCATATPGAPSSIRGQVQLDFEYHGEPPLIMPTAVAVASAGTVYVADGVNDRILQFAASGAFAGEITHVGPEPLSRPMGLKVDREDRLWIVDAGHNRVLVRAASGALTQRIDFDPNPGIRATDITDIGLAPDGRTVWLVDNDTGCLIRFDCETRRETRVGSRGEAIGQFQYPFMIAVAANGNLYVTDVINGRVAALDSTGQPLRAISSYGVDVGQLYRPKGIALDRDGNVWVSDGTLGVVQVFSQTGVLLGVLRRADGDPLRFDMPAGLAFDAAGALYVVESQANRVRQVRVQVDLAADRPLPSADRTTIATRQPKTCTACHLEWMPPLDQGRDTELIAVPPNPPEHPYASRGQVCLSCHDGSVVDSRRRVWLEHGHGEQIMPPTEMTVPPNLPLADGMVVCRTCHSAHTRGGSGNVFRDAVFLRVESDPTELCTACHAGFEGGSGMHPLVEMSIDLPQGRVGDAAPASNARVTCLACHIAHGARDEALLVRSPNSNELCLACHRQLTPALFGDDARSAHGRLPMLDGPQQEVASEFATRLGPNGDLLCVTCHMSHRARSDEYLLAFDPRQQDVCSACHAEQRSVVGSSHDLRTNFPVAKNILGITASSGGACSGCHTAHRFARTARVTALDPTGRCIACHDHDQIAASKRLGNLNHPQSECAACHNAHEVRFGHYLNAQPAERCRECHADYAGLSGGPHDLSRNAEAWPSAAQDTGDVCLACHRPHGTPESGLFRVASTTGPRDHDATCLPCHADSAPDTDGRIALVHPRQATNLHDQHGLPLVVGADGQPRLACKTCHDPHGGVAAGTRLLRVAGARDGEELCLSCHSEMANIRMIGHAAEWLHAARFEAGTCQPCHLIHAAPDTIEGRIMWPKQLCAHGDPSIPPSSVADHYCLSCHYLDGPAPLPVITTHPQAEMFNPDKPDTPGFLPLFNAQGAIDPNGRIACRTCHLSHGRSAPAPVPAQIEEINARELRARKWHIRSFAADNLCTTCHGFDALRRYMYFHDPARRGGPIEGGNDAAPPPRSPS